MSYQIATSWLAAMVVAIATTMIPMILFGAPTWAWFGCSMIAFNVQFLGTTNQSKLARWR